MTDKEITSAVPRYGERKYKCSDSEHKIDEEKLLCELRKRVYPALDIPTWRNIKYPNAHIFDLVVRAGLRNSFIEDTSNSLNRKGIRVADADTVYRRIKKVDTEEWTEKWEIANKKLLLLARKQRLLPVMPCLSIDTHPVMFYGDKEADGVMGTKPKKGTCYAFQYLTACLSDCESHFTLASLPLKKDVNLWDALELVLKKALQFVDHRFLVYVDRGFYSTPVINLFDEYGQKYLMPAKKTAPVKKLIKENPAPCVIPYTIHGKYGSAETNLVIVKNKEGKVKVFATNLEVDASQAEKLFEMYSNRWTIETSYRMVGQVRMNSKSLDYGVRWFLFFFGALIKNGYWLFNGVIAEYDHVTLITFAELFIEVTGALFWFYGVKGGVIV